MEGTFLLLAVLALYFGFVIRDAAKGEVHLRGGMVIRRRDNPFGFWLVLTIAFVWGGVVLISITGADLTQIIPAINATAASLHF